MTILDDLRLLSYPRPSRKIGKPAIPAGSVMLHSRSPVADPAGMAGLPIFRLAIRDKNYQPLFLTTVPMTSRKSLHDAHAALPRGFP